MSACPLVGPVLAQARALLKRARTAQANALIWSQGVYLAGFRGSTARRMVRYWHAKRALWIGEAMAERQRAKLIRFAGAATERASHLRIVK